MAFICGSAVTFSSLTYACPFRPTQRAPDWWESARFQAGSWLQADSVKVV
jgi:hypothetical protein